MTGLLGASLNGAELQGASLDGTDLQGASLYNAQLQGASLYEAQLQGASLNESKLQGASLYEAQLQGASLNGAQLEDVAFGGSYLWRANWGELNRAMKPIRFVHPRWKALRYQDEPWTDRTYDELRKRIEGEVPQGDARVNALERIARLDCKKSGDDLASCAENAKLPSAVRKWRGLLEAAQADESTYAKALARRLRMLVCSSEANAIHILRGVSNGFFPRLEATGREAPALIDDILKGKDCPVSAALTDADKARLQKIRAEALKNNSESPEAAKTPQPSVAASPPAPPVKAPAKGNRRSPRDRPSP
ncbi:MAG: pentapeptide repeat-containing protein [Methylocystis sp.]|uniref:pentapeptide repeat-containing protein n=1 Tax=Methylocystis sp. TaxID=1911079 RepID=UPI00392B3393